MIRHWDEFSSIYSDTDPYQFKSDLKCKSEIYTIAALSLKTVFRSPQKFKGSVLLRSTLYSSYSSMVCMNKNTKENKTPHCHEVDPCQTSTIKTKPIIKISD